MPPPPPPPSTQLGDLIPSSPLDPALSFLHSKSGCAAIHSRIHCHLLLLLLPLLSLCQQRLCAGLKIRVWKKGGGGRGGGGTTKKGSFLHLFTPPQKFWRGSKRVPSGQALSSRAGKNFYVCLRGTFCLSSGEKKKKKGIGGHQ